MIGDRPTHFVRRIHASLNPAGYNGRHTPKLHTIRKDEPDRWRAGLKIQFVVNNRRPNRIQFAEGKCTSVQQIVITYHGLSPVVEVDGKLIKGAELERLAINDGFETVRDFFLYFSENFNGKIIHWTDLKY